MFQVGQKVVCVNSTPRMKEALIGPLGFDALKERTIYTIRGVFRGNTEWCVYLDEIVRPDWLDGHELPFAMERFRPIQERKTDISIFTAMLNKKLVPQDEQV